MLAGARVLTTVRFTKQTQNTLVTEFFHNSSVTLLRCFNFMFWVFIRRTNLRQISALKVSLQSLFHSNSYISFFLVRGYNYTIFSLRLLNKRISFWFPCQLICIHWKNLWKNSCKAPTFSRWLIASQKKPTINGWLVIFNSRNYLFHFILLIVVMR